jgi:hypothetical protein
MRLEIKRICCFIALQSDGDLPLYGEWEDLEHGT